MDHLYTNSAQFIDHVLNKPVAGYDHNMIMCRMNLSVPAFIPKVIEMRKLSKFTPEQFLQEFSSLDHDEFMLSSDVDEMVRILVDNILKVLDKLAPMQKVQIKSRHAKYLTPVLKESIEIRDEIQRIAIKSGGDQDCWRIFKQARNALRRKLDKEKKDWTRGSLKKADAKGKWRIVREQAGLEVKKAAGIKIRIDGEIEDDPLKVAEEFSSYYVDKVEKVVQEHPPDPDAAKLYTERFIRGKRIQNMDFIPVNRCNRRRWSLLHTPEEDHLFSSILPDSNHKFLNNAMQISYSI